MEEKRMVLSSGRDEPGIPVPNNNSYNKHTHTDPNNLRLAIFPDVLEQ